MMEKADSTAAVLVKIVARPPTKSTRLEYVGVLSTLYLVQLPDAGK